MNKKHKILGTIIGAILFSLLSLPAYAQTQDVVFAEVDRNELSTDEFLNLSVTINTGSGPASEPGLSNLDGFDVVGTSTSTQMSIINGAISSETCAPELPEYIRSVLSWLSRMDRHSIRIQLL